jgi:hypothetical protein
MIDRDFDLGITSGKLLQVYERIISDYETTKIATSKRDILFKLKQKVYK